MKQKGLYPLTEFVELIDALIVMKENILGFAVILKNSYMGISSHQDTKEIHNHSGGGIIPSQIPVVKKIVSLVDGISSQGKDEDGNHKSFREGIQRVIDFVEHQSSLLRNVMASSRNFPSWESFLAAK